MNKSADHQEVNNQHHNMKFNQIISALSFILLFCIIFYFSSQVLGQKYPTRTAEDIRFRNEPRNTIDVLFIGSSGYYRGISPLVLWKNYGISSYVRSSHAQTSVGLYYSLIETLERQKPELVVIDGVLLTKEFNFELHEPYLHEYLDPMPLSVRKLTIIFDLWQLDNRMAVSDYIFPIFRFHERWKKIKTQDFKNTKIETTVNQKGQNASSEISIQTMPEEYMQSSNNPVVVAVGSKQYFDKIMELCKKKSIKVVFVTLPKLGWSIPKHNLVEMYAQLNNSVYLDYSFPKEMNSIGINLESDFLDLNHLNFSGSQKASIALGKDLVEMYGLKDHREDPKFASWDLLYDAFQAEYQKNSPMPPEKKTN